LLVESAALGLAGGVLGIGVGWIVLAALKRLSTDVFPMGFPIELDARVLAVSLIVALATSVLFGLVPALHASRLNVHGALVESGTRAIAGGAGRWPRRLLVVGEVAIGVVLLVSAGLLVRTFVHLRSLDPGFDPTHVITASASLQDARYHDAARVDRLFSDTLLRIRQVPGVQGAGVSLGLPYTRLLNLGFRRLDGVREGDEGGITSVSYVTPGYLEALRIPLRTGRVFVEADSASAPWVAIVNEEFVRKYYKGQNVVGRRIAVSGEREIVGIVGNARTTSPGYAGYGEPLVTPPIIYIPAAQTTAGFLKLVHTWFAPAWVVRASGPRDAIAAALRQAIRTVDPMLPIARLESMADVQAASVASQRFMMALVVGLGGVALLLAAIGIHGLIASSVSDRTRELGIRLALGATRGQMMRTVVLPGVALAAAGIAIGSAGAFSVGRLMQSFLWGVTPSDPITFVAVIVTLLSVALIASVIPALRVLRLDPALTLRAE
jgi:predicted permease